jgi:hypothetical protein
VSSLSPLIVWDLDHTLGVFDVLDGAVDMREPITVRLRPGIAGALERLIEAGFRNVILTKASPSYAELVVRATGLKRFFLELSAGGQRPKGDDVGLAATFGIPPERKPDLMLFVGDQPLQDAAKDERIVFHLEDDPLHRPAGPLAALILELFELGGGSIRRGFDVLAGPPRHDGRPIRVVHGDLGPLILLPRHGRSPILGFDEEGKIDRDGTPVTFVPADYSLTGRR